MMKIFLLLFLGTFSKEDELKCRTDILNGYLLIGRKIAKKDYNVVCPDLEDNCCTKVDQ